MSSLPYLVLFSFPLWQGEGKQYDLPVKKKSDICTIMYTSGTTGDPKGVLMSNESIVTITAGVRHFLAIFNESVSFLLSNLSWFTWKICNFELKCSKLNKQLTEKDVYISYLPLAHVFDRAVEECIIQVGGSIGFWRGVSTSRVPDLPTQLCICLLCFFANVWYVHVSYVLSVLRMLSCWLKTLVS